MKKILAILLAVVMTFSMLVPAAALNTNQSINANSSAAVMSASVDESTSEYDGCFKTLYDIVHAIVHFVSAILDFDCPFCGGDKDDSDDTFTYEAVDVTAAQLKDILLANVQRNGDGSIISATVELTENYRVTDEWTSMVYETSTYIPMTTTLTVNGNDHVIAGLTAPLFAGNVAANISISDLTIADSNIANGNENGSGRGAIVAYADAYVASLSFSNCNVINTEITAENSGASFVGYVSAGSISFTNCTANGVKINAGNNAAGIVGHLMTGSTEAKIENCKVKNCTFTSTQNRVGQIVGTVNGNGVLNVVNCEFTGDVCDPNRAYATINVTNA